MGRSALPSGKTFGVDAGLDQAWAGAFGAELFAAGFNLDGLADGAVAESASHAVVEEFEVGVLELDDFAAVDADEVIVARAFVEIRIVGGLVATEVDFVEQAGFDEQGDGAVDGGAGGVDVLFSDALEEFLGGEMFLGGEGKADDRIALRRASEPLLANKVVEFVEDRVVHGCRLGGWGAVGKLFSDGICCFPDWQGRWDCLNDGR